jgi:NAD(P)-dependent dehydrogenase (short-subunit alcohol dehydrogenase family)
VATLFVLAGIKNPHLQRNAFCHKFNCQTESGKQSAESGKHRLAPLTNVEDALRRGEQRRQNGRERNRMNISFEGKVALVTGAASGLGLATAKAFAESGAAVVLADVDENQVQAAAKDLADTGFKTLAIGCDVSKDDEVEAIVKQTVARFGRLDAAYNNAGIQNVLAETADSPRDDYDRVMAVNLRGVWSCMKFELQVMREQGSGAIVNCSSLGGLVGGSQRGTYHAAKHGVIGLTKSAARRGADRTDRWCRCANA